MQIHLALLIFWLLPLRYLQCRPKRCDAQHWRPADRHWRMVSRPACDWEPSNKQRSDSEGDDRMDGTRDWCYGVSSYVNPYTFMTSIYCVAGGQVTKKSLGERMLLSLPSMAAHCRYYLLGWTSVLVEGSSRPCNSREASAGNPQAIIKDSLVGYCERTPCRHLLLV